ncbi:MAG: flagellar hook-associated protein FlgK [Campylobacterales bacterium]|nr:flagellar hook-associated protein FlgK [Campylobacterales bacterium]
MASIFNSLYTGYSGLVGAQIGIDVTGHNISNAETEGYTRQRAVASAATPLSIYPGQVGNGVEITEIKRVFDNFVFDRYTDASASKEYSEYEKQTLETLSTFFPEIDQVGIKENLSEFYNMWQTLADNPDNDAIKTALTKQAQSLTTQIQQTQEQVLGLQSQVNEQLAVNVDEVNQKAKEIAELNKYIDSVEAGGLYNANDLRDKRNVLEKDLARLIGAERTEDQLTSNIQIDSKSNTLTGSYTIQVNGFNIVDGGTYHPIHLKKDDNPNGFYELSYERQDGSLIPMSEEITDGRIGAMLELRGHSIDTTSGVPKDGVIQNVVAELDAFANGLIEATNNIYASSSRTKMQSNTINIDGDTPLINSNYNVKEGSFNIVIYDIDGNKVATREIDINAATTMSSSTNGNSIKEQLEAQNDDNSDNNANNDVDDYVNFDFQENGSSATFYMDPQKLSQGYTFAIEDNLTTDSFDSGTNFAGAFGFNRFFDGNNAKDIRVNLAILDNPSTITAGKSSVDGDNSIALDMVQQQFEEYTFKIGDIEKKSTIYGMFDNVATNIGSTTNAAIIRNETINAQFNAVEMEYLATSKVSIDEEMTNLIKYQTSYGAAAKVITTIDQMMNTLLGIKS